LIRGQIDVVTDYERSTYGIANRVFLHINPDPANLHAMSVEGSAKLRNLGRVGLAGVTRASAWVPVRVDVGVTSCASVVVRGDEVGIDSSADGAGLLVTSDDGLGEALVVSTLPGGCRNELRGVNTVDEGQGGGCTGKESESGGAEHFGGVGWRGSNE
jgi:hypothetical protein